MLTEGQKRLLENRIYRLIKESMFESNKVANSANRLTKSTDTSYKNSKAAKRASVLKWLRSQQMDLAPLAYELAGLTDTADENEKGTVRSEFYKKMDPNDTAHNFSDDEINRLYNMKDRFIQKLQR